MKKIASVAAIALFAVAFTSCKKDYTCECTSTTNGVSSNVTYEMKDVKKKDAKSACSGMETSVTAAGVTSSTTCNLK